MQGLQVKYLSLSTPVAYDKERVLPISEMYVYPIIGVQATAKVDSLEIGMHGIRYEREIILLDANDLSPVRIQNFLPLACLRQEL